MATRYQVGDPVFLIPHGEEARRVPAFIDEIQRNADGLFQCYLVAPVGSLSRYYTDGGCELEPRDLGPSVWARLLKPEV